MIDGENVSQYAGNKDSGQKGQDEDTDDSDSTEEKEEEDDSVETAVMLGIGGLVIAVSIGFAFSYLKNER